MSTFPKKGTRSITVNGEVYRWYGRPSALNYGYFERHLAIQHGESRNGQLVLLDLWNVFWNAGISPKIIREAILFALQHDWTPKAAGNPIYLSVDDNGQIQRLPEGKQYRDRDY